jgi:predicted metal-dependent phosphoesterase TrpH
LVQKTHGFLKADFHIHTHEDLYDSWLVKYSAKDLIRAAAKQKFQVLSITNHRKVFFNNELKNYAKKKGILLIPGAEPRIKGADVLIINTTNEELAKIKKLDDLYRIKDSALIIAPHPYLITGACLRDKLVKHIDSFHAIEFSHVSTKLMINPFFKFLTGNTKAVEVAKKYNKPIVGTSDAHKLYEFGTTYTKINSSKKTDDVIDAVKHNRIKLVANPLPTHLFFRRLLGIAYKEGLLARVLLRNHIKNKKKIALAKDLNNP